MVNEERREDTWSNLPKLLIWMIKARLYYPTNLRFAAVCKSWLHASSTYPSNYQSAVDAMLPPWIMTAKNSHHEFISTLTGEKYTIDLPDLSDIFTMFSKQGWLFLKKKLRDDLSDSPFFLLNPFTKATIKLPYVTPRYGHGAFTTVDGNPRCIVLASACFVSESHVCINLAITHPGDNTWATYTYRSWDLLKFCSMAWIVVIGKLVYCVDATTHVLIFDLENLEWTGLVEKSDVVWFKFEKYIMESKGKVLRVCFPQDRTGGGDSSATISPMFYRLNDTNTDWEPLNHKDLEDTCWFLRKGGGGCSFVFKENGAEKIYSSCRNLEGDGCVKFSFCETGKLGRRFLLDLFCDAVWVDMG